MSTSAEIEGLVNEMAQKGTVPVPPYPGVAMRLRQLVAGDHYGLAEVARLVSEDQILTAAVLRAANTAARRGLVPVTTLRDAVTRLGGDELVRVALAQGLGLLAGAIGPLAELRRMAWRQGLVSAFTCRQLAISRREDPEEAFVCGLLHDLGRLVAIAAIESVVPARPTAWERTEAEWLSIVDNLHLALGTMTAERWNLPPRLVAVMTWHHAPEQAGAHKAMAELVRASDAVTTVLEETPFVLARDLVGLSALRGKAEADGLMKILPLLPRFLTSLEVAAAERARDVASFVTAETGQGPEGPTHPFDRAATWMRPTGEEAVRIVAVGFEGLVLVVRERIREHTLVWLRVAVKGRALEICARVVRSEVVIPDGHKVTMRLYALGPEVREGWEALCRE